MSCTSRWLALSLLWITCSVAAPAQTLPTHPVRSISPTDTSFADLEFLVREIGSAQVVMLGEPTHGEGNVTEAKVRLMRFLQQRLGFTTVAFESGFYELDMAQRQIAAGVPVQEAIEASVFGVWTSTREFQQVLPLLGKGRLRVAGFDSQLSGAYQESQLEELEALLKPEKGGSDLAYDYLEECLSTMGESFIFPPSHQILLFDMQLGKARKLLEKVAAGPNAQRRERAIFWLQNLRSLQALAHDYATNDPGVRDSTEWTATTSNPRDSQMADNLLWYLRQHPQEKVICWGALGHLANKVHILGDEVKDFRSMGQAVKAKLGPDAVYVLGTLAGGGTHGFDSWRKAVAVPTPAPGTLEAQLLAKDDKYSFVSLKHDAPGQTLTTYAFEYKPLTGRWSEVVDGFLFLQSVNPPHAAAPVAGAAPEATPTAAGAAPRSAGPQWLNPAARTAASKTGAASTLSGTVLDQKTGAPVPFATVAVPSRSAGTISDAQGRFRLPSRPGETVQVSSIGYEPVTLTARASSGQLAVRLVPAAFALADVRVSAQSQDPRRIMKKVIKAAATNYERQDYTAQVYTRRRVTNFDTLRYEVEYVSEVLDPVGFKEWGGGFLMMGPRQAHVVLEKHAVVPATEPTDYAVYQEAGHGFYTAGADPVRISPLFKSGTLGKYQLRLDSIEQRGGEAFYVLRFAVKRASKRATGMTHANGYSGKLYVRQHDYAVVRYEALWQEDTVRNNAIARKYHGTKSVIARFYPSVLSDQRKAHVVTYEQGANGRYHVATSVAQLLSMGHVLGGKPFYAQKSCEEYFTPLPQPTAADLLKTQDDPKLRYGELWQASKTPHRPLFWQSYQRPQPREAAPQLEVSKP